MANKKIAVLGIGNILMGDDGVGVRVVERLAQEVDLDGVELVDAGTSAMDMLGYFLDFEMVIVVDSLRGGQRPGTVYKLTPEQLGAYSKNYLSLHDVQILDLVNLSSRFGKHPEVVLIGVEPKEINESLELSPEIEAVIPLVTHVIKEIVLVKTEPDVPG